MKSITALFSLVAGAILKHYVVVSLQKYIETPLKERDRNMMR
jgi:hypothetical protein